MNFFSEISDGQAIVHSGGVYRQVPLFERMNVMGEGKSLREMRVIYAKMGNGFVRLSQGGATSSPRVKWSEIDAGASAAWREAGGFVEYLPTVARAAE